MTKWQRVLLDSRNTDDRIRRAEKELQTRPSLPHWVAWLRLLTRDHYPYTASGMLKAANALIQTLGGDFFVESRKRDTKFEMKSDGTRLHGQASRRPEYGEQAGPSGLMHYDWELSIFWNPVGESPTANFSLEMRFNESEFHSWTYEDGGLWTDEALIAVCSKGDGWRRQ